MTKVTAVSLGPGTLTFTPEGGSLFEEFAHQVTECEVKPSVTKTEGKRVLDGKGTPSARHETCVLALTFYQDLGELKSVSKWTWDNRGKVTDFVFTPSTAKGTTITGQLTVEATNLGGKTDEGHLEAQTEWECVGMPTIG